MKIAFRFAVPFQVLRALVNPETARARIARHGEELAARLRSCPNASANERLDFVLHALGSEVIPVLPQTMPSAVAGFGLFFLAMKLLGQSASPAEMENVLRGLPHNVTTEMDLDLWRVACEIRKDQAANQLMRSQSVDELGRRFHERKLPDVAQREIRDFLAKYGQRAVAEIDLGMPRWSDDPSHILGVIANYLRLEDQRMSPDEIFARGVKDAESTIETLVSRARTRGRTRAALVRFALKRTRQLGGLREIPKYYLIVAIAAIRKELARIGVELVQSGVLTTADDIFFLNFTEVRKAIAGQEFKTLVAERKQEYWLELHRRHVPNVLLSDGTEPEATMPSRADTDGLSWAPASTGVIQGLRVSSLIRWARILNLERSWLHPLPIPVGHRSF